MQQQGKAISAYQKALELDPANAVSPVFISFVTVIALLAFQFM